MGVPPISGIGPFCVLQAGSVHGVNPYPVSVIGILPLSESGGKDKKMTDMMNCVDKLLEKKISGYKQRMDVPPYGVYR
mgnify:FL=1